MMAVPSFLVAMDIAQLGTREAMPKQMTVVDWA